MKELFKKVVIGILTFEAKLLLLRTTPKIIAITGSVGKTSTKDAIFTAIKDHVHARKSEKSFNSDIGVVLTVLGLPNGWNNPIAWLKNIIDGAFHVVFCNGYPKVLVLEMGVDRKGDMKHLTAWINPDIVVLTCFPKVPVHVEYFKSPREVIEEKMILVRALKKNGICVYNADDELIVEEIKKIPQLSFSYGKNNQAHFSTSDERVMYDGAMPSGVAYILSHVQEKIEVQVHGTLGNQHVYVGAAALAVATQLGVSLTDAARALKTQTPVPGRMRTLRGIHGSTLLDDTYNSSPVATANALLSLSGLTTQGRKIAVLGDMLELGQFSVREHERVGELLVGTVDILFTLGVRSHKVAEAAIAHGFDQTKVFQYEDVARLANDIVSTVEKDDIVLIKGSQSMRAEKVTYALMLEKEKAGELLVRQDAFWTKK
jgi:UDP-N-acetylmuramoyl-tripeptide--D-alanyl-D-alanine ligase